MNIVICDKCGSLNPSEEIKIQYNIYKFCNECFKRICIEFGENRTIAIKTAANKLLLT